MKYNFAKHGFVKGNKFDASKYLISFMDLDEVHTDEALIQFLTPQNDVKYCYIGRTTFENFLRDTSSDASLAKTSFIHVKEISTYRLSSTYININLIEEVHPDNTHNNYALELIYPKYTRIMVVNDEEAVGLNNLELLKLKLKLENIK